MRAVDVVEDWCMVEFACIGALAPCRVPLTHGDIDGIPLSARCTRLRA